MNEKLQPPVRPISEVLDDIHREVIKNFGRLFTGEEAISLVDEIRAELREKGEIKNA